MTPDKETELEDDLNLLEDPDEGETEEKEPAKEPAKEADSKADDKEGGDEEKTGSVGASEEEEPDKEADAEPAKKLDKNEFLTRLKKETWKRREAERQRDEAVDFARRVNEERTKDRQTARTATRAYVEESSASVEQLFKNAQDELLRAHEAADPEKMVEAQTKLTELALKKQRAADRAERLKEIEAEPEEKPTFQPQRGPDERTLEWTKKNPWYGKDEILTAAAWTIHQRLAKQGVFGNTDSYWKELDTGMRDAFPHKFGNKPASKPSVVAAVSRRSSAPSKIQRSSDLTDSQKAVAKRLGVTEQQYLEEYNKELGN